jgi:hypothetical protein
MLRHALIFALLILCGCHAITLHPGTMEPGAVVYAKYGGYGMRRAVKPELEKRGFDVRVGRIRNFRDADADGDDDADITEVSVPRDARYVINVRERRERFNPVWCFFNGYWWWNFNLSVSDQKTGREVLSWAGRGCKDSTLRKFARLVKKLESDVPPPPAVVIKRKPVNKVPPLVRVPFSWQ